MLGISIQWLGNAIGRYFRADLLLPLRGQFSVFSCHNISASHLVAAIASSEKAQPTTGAMVSLEGSVARDLHPME